MPYYKPVISPIARFIRRRWRPFAYRGTGFTCPLCGGTFRRRAEGEGKNCPGCGCPDRARLFWLYLEREWPRFFEDPAVLIEFAPIPILEKRLRMLPNLKYLSSDPYEPEAMIRLDLRDLDLPDESFDYVICMHVLAHIANDRKAMREMLRILRPGGVAFIMTPVDDDRAVTFEDPCIIDPREKSKIYGHSDYVRTYGRDFTDRLRESGFDVAVVRPARDLDEATLKTCDLWDDVIYVSRRPLPVASDRSTVPSGPGSG